MLNYDFRNLLSAYEFECFCRDLINKHEGLDLANFAEGRDGGIDLRYTHGKGGTVIVQAKRYKEYKELIPKLKKEVDKVKRLNPQRYMLTTSVDLTPANKQEIITLFAPYIKNENDILGKQDLNKILASHPTVEQRYYKLWLTSTSILFNILKKNVINWTEFERHEIEETVKTYVMNDSFDEALNKLLKNRYVVISGVPGIGKTTLARMLVIHLLSDKFTTLTKIDQYEDFYYTDSQIDDLAGVMQEGRRQVFFFDDFMGRIAFEEGEKNFNSRIVKFIKTCQQNKDKLLILTTREYILQQGLTHYARFNDGQGLEMSKCIVDMGKYTRFVRAQILYNHLVANEIPQSYIDALLKDKNYLKIIDHSHFSPRIIETFLDKKAHEYCAPEDYYKTINGFFDHPDSVWLDAFKRLSDVGREALLILSTMNGVVMFDDWKEAYSYFFYEVHKEANYLDDRLWKEAVKMLQDNFIKIRKGVQGLYVYFYNPGVIDVLTRFIKDNHNIKRLLLDHTYFVEQVFGVFRDDRRINPHADVPVELYSSFVNAFDKCWHSYRSCNTILYFKGEKSDESYVRSPQSKTTVLSWLCYDYKTMLSTMPGYVEQKMTMDIMTDKVEDNLASQLSLLNRVNISEVHLDMDLLFENYLYRIVDSADLLCFVESVEKVFPDYVEYIESEEFCSMAVEYLKQDLDNTSDDDLEELNDIVHKLCEYIPELEYESVTEDIEKAYNAYNDYIESRAEEYYEDYHHGYNNRHGEDSYLIDNLFSSLKQ